MQTIVPPRNRAYKQIDVFTNSPLQGNPLGVIIDSEGLGDQQMQRIASWLNLSETTFISPPTKPEADYKIRIFTPEKELPFAGHPSLGSAHALLEDGIQTKSPNRIVQECGVGLVPIAIANTTNENNQVVDRTLSFRSPAGQVTMIHDQSKINTIVEALEIQDVIADVHNPPATVNMGIRWMIIRLKSAQDCLSYKPKKIEALSNLLETFQVDGVSIYGPYEQNHGSLQTNGVPAVNYELRAFTVENGSITEDPVTGSANACLSYVLQESLFPDGQSTAQSYLVRQGTCRGRDGRILVTYYDGESWIGGQAITLIKGNLFI